MLHPWQQSALDRDAWKAMERLFVAIVIPLCSCANTTPGTLHDDTRPGIGVACDPVLSRASDVSYV